MREDIAAVWLAAGWGARRSAAASLGEAETKPSRDNPDILSWNSLSHLKANNHMYILQMEFCVSNKMSCGEHT